MSLTNFPVDLLLLGMVAAFLILRLRSVLGKRTGFERDTAPVPRSGIAAGVGKVINVKPETLHNHSEQRIFPDRDTPIGQVFLRIQGIDGQFSPARFLDGAEGAFRLIVIAFAKGDRVGLRALLTLPMMEAFERAIGEREKARLTQHTMLHSILSATFEGATLAGNRARIEVRFVSDQVSYTNDESGHTLFGTEAVTEITDLWTFERELGSRDPAWRLAATQSG